MFKTAPDVERVEDGKFPVKEDATPENVHLSLADAASYAQETPVPENPQNGAAGVTCTPLYFMSGPPPSCANAEGDSKVNHNWTTENDRLLKSNRLSAGLN